MKRMKVRKISISVRLFIILVALLVVGDAILGIAISRKAKSALIEQIMDNSVGLASCAAASVDVDMLNDIAEGDEGSEAYNAVLDSLAIYRDNADIEYIYTVRKDEDGLPIYIVDADEEDPCDIGEEFEESDGLMAAFAGTAKADEESMTDEWGEHRSAYAPVYDGDEVVAIVGIDMSMDWINQQVMAIYQMVAILCLVILIVSLFVLFIITNYLKNSFASLNNKVLDLTDGSCDLTKEIEFKRGDEFEVIADSMNCFIREVRQLVYCVSVSAESLQQCCANMHDDIGNNNSILKNMNNQIDSISAGMEECSASSELATEDLKDTAERVRIFAEDVASVKNNASKANSQAEALGQEMNERKNSAKESIDRIKEDMINASKEAESIEKVKEIAEQIAAIASEIRMLSLNAQIEAARAGEMGAGFAVVATEVGRLSAETDVAVSQIAEINNQALGAVKRLLDISDEMVSFMTENVMEDYESFAKFGRDYEVVTSAICQEVDGIYGVSKALSETVTSISDNIKEINTTVSVSAGGAGELAGDSGEISTYMDNLLTLAKENEDESEKLNTIIKKYHF